jgi:hypothetical protein
MWIMAKTDISTAKRTEGIPTLMSGYAIFGEDFRIPPPGAEEEERNEMRS